MDKTERRFLCVGKGVGTRPYFYILHNEPPRRSITGDKDDMIRELLPAEFGMTIDELVETLK